MHAVSMPHGRHVAKLPVDRPVLARPSSRTTLDVLQGVTAGDATIFLTWRPVTLLHPVATHVLSGALTSEVVETRKSSGANHL
jgi:hypothetical protein